MECLRGARDALGAISRPVVRRAVPGQGILKSLDKNKSACDLLGKLLLSFAAIRQDVSTVLLRPVLHNAALIAITALTDLRPVRISL